MLVSRSLQVILTRTSTCTNTCPDHTVDHIHMPVPPGTKLLIDLQQRVQALTLLLETERQRLNTELTAEHERRVAAERDWLAAARMACACSARAN